MADDKESGGGLLEVLALRRRAFREELEAGCREGMRRHIEQQKLPLTPKEVMRLLAWQRYQLRDVLQKIEDQTLSDVVNMLTPIRAKSDSKMLDSNTGEELEL